MNEDMPARPYDVLANAYYRLRDEHGTTLERLQEACELLRKAKPALEDVYFDLTLADEITTFLEDHHANNS